ncbi:MAG: hypothetical protein GKR92_12130 [Gammaproteobacteria bacterium]|nr:MAG: hypothetical protein GKR92_12130 [Gammaproteobacteria bacterium]
MARLKTKWNQAERKRKPEEIAGVIGFNLWVLAAESCLFLENEGFETASRFQRLDVIGEFIAFGAHVADRMVFDEMSAAEREIFINALGQHLADTMQSNRSDVEAGEYRSDFINLLNERMNEYSECSYNEEDGPSFSMRRIAGNYVRDVMGEKDNKWIPDYVIDSEIPKHLLALKRVFKGQSPSLSEADFAPPPIPESGVWGEE